jgi:hypothetical protein
MAWCLVKLRDYFTFYVLPKYGLVILVDVLIYLQWVPVALSLGVKQSGREADHSLPSSAEFMNAWSYTSNPPIHLHGVVLS